MAPELSAHEEAQRLSALHAYRLMDSPAEPALDDLTALAAEICEAPTATISLLDERRQWFMSRVGMEVSETPRSISFCRHALAQRDLLIVPDATKDERFAHSPLVTGGLKIRFYAGAPLITPKGLVLGALCVTDRIPRELRPAQARALRILAQQVMTHFELRREMREREESDRLQKAIFEAEPDCLKLISASGRVQMMNDAGLRFIEADSFDQIAGQNVFPLIHEEYRKPIQELIDRVFAGETAAMEFRLTGFKGTPRWLDLHAAPLRDEDGEVTSLVGISRDITKRKQSDARFRWLFDSNAQGIAIFKTTGEVLEANQAYLDLVGYTRADLEAGLVDWIKMTPPKSLQLEEEAQRQLAATGVCPPFEKEYIRKDGSLVPLLIGVTVFADEPGVGIAFTVDLTERKKLERQVLQAQRLASVATLAQGIAHDLNNALTPVLASLEVLQTRFAGPESRNLLRIIESSARRGVAMSQQILSFAMGSAGLRKPLRVETLLRETERMVLETFLQKVRVRTEIRDHLWPVSGDAAQLRQVLLNLCLNARDAMPEGGVLTLSAWNATLDPHDAGLIPGAQPGEYVAIQVEDSGPGIAPEIADRIFDPFFTTKPFGRATGLGLSTALGIVKGHGGFMRFHTNPGQGTRFEIFLPAGREPSPREEVTSAAALPRGAGELILIVDDEPAVREVTRQTLESFGYRVVVAAGGTEAFAALGNSPKIAGAIVDMYMPVFDGPMTIRVLRRMSPSLAIVLSSGKHVDVKALDIGVEHFLPKPYTAASLLAALQSALDSRV